MSIKKPHILLASANPVAMLENIKHIINEDAVLSIKKEIDKNVKELFMLGEEHFLFSTQIPIKFWRQKVSRLYYGIYNVRKSVMLNFQGEYHTDVSDHKNIDKIPDDFPNLNKYKNYLHVLRDDRNLADYDHSATVDDLIIPIKDSEELVKQFIFDARDFLLVRGILL